MILIFHSPLFFRYLGLPTHKILATFFFFSFGHMSLNKSWHKLLGHMNKKESLSGVDLRSKSVSIFASIRH